MTLHPLRVSVLALLLPAALAAQQVVANSSKILIGDGVISKGSNALYTGSNNVPFRNAMAALASGGQNSGTIEVLPGTYTFVQTVSVSTTGVRISGGPSARIVAAAGLGTALFTVAATADDFVLDGLTLVDHRAVPPAAGIVLAQANRFSMTDCRVFVSDNGTAGTVSAAIDLGAPGSGDLYGALIQGNSFHAGGMGANPAGAPRRAFLRSRDGRTLRVLGNEFRGFSTTAPTSVGNAIVLDDEQWSSITGNTFNWLTSAMGAPESNGLVTNFSTDGEACHLTLSGNFFEFVGGECLVNLSGAGYSAITGNVFGRQGTGPSGTIRLQGGEGNVVSGNGFHFKTDDHPAVVVNGGSAVSISGNCFYKARVAQIRFTDVIGGAIQSNQFQTALVPASAIDLIGNGAPPPGQLGFTAVVCANSLRGSWGGVAVTAGPTPYFVLDSTVNGGNPIH